MLLTVNPRMQCILSNKMSPSSITWYFGEKGSLNNDLPFQNRIEKHEKWVILDEKVRLYTWYFDENGP